MKRKTKFQSLLIALSFSAAGLFSACQQTDSNITVHFADKNNQAFIGHPIPYEITGLGQDTVKQIALRLLATDNQKTAYQKDIARTILTHDRHLHDTLLIPDNVRAGNYDVQLEVQYTNGSVKQTNSKLSIKVDSTVPMASQLEVGINAEGSDLHLESALVVPKGIAYAEVEISSSTLKKEYKYDKGNMLGAQQHTFHEHVDLTDYPTGNYQVVLSVSDQEKRIATASGSFVKK